jgi:hypothetical protein
MGVGVLSALGAMLFGGGTNRVKETVELFRTNAEASAVRFHEMDAAALQQLAAEFSRPQRGLFDAFVDGLNRLPRPVIVLSLLFLVALPIFDPLWATEIYSALALVPDAIWVLMSVVFTFYFGGRMQAKEIDFTRSMAGAAAQLPAVLSNISAVRELSENSPGVADTGTDAETQLVAIGTDDTDNAAVSAWLQQGKNA